MSYWHSLHSQKERFYNLLDQEPGGLEKSQSPHVGTSST
jgi:hypothetical protein